MFSQKNPNTHIVIFSVFADSESLFSLPPIKHSCENKNQMSKFVFIKNIRNFVDTRFAFARKLKATQKRCNSSRSGAIRINHGQLMQKRSIYVSFLIIFHWTSNCLFPSTERILTFVLWDFFGYTLGIGIWFHIVVLLAVGCCWVYCVWKIRKCKNSKENKRKWGFF